MIMRVRKVTEEAMNIIPMFIDTKMEKGLIHWDKVTECNMIILTLLKKCILSDVALDTIIKRFDISFSDDVIDVDVFFDCYFYFSSMLEGMLELCLEYEEYESCENIVRFQSVYKDLMLIGDDWKDLDKPLEDDF